MEGSAVLARVIFSVYISGQGCSLFNQFYIKAADDVRWKSSP